jgi:N-methylhydantoinase B/oxoprolinase/acetone carboxylase alpha subunit
MIRSNLLFPSMACSTVLASLLIATAAQAQLSSPNPSFDLRGSCPGVDAELQNALASVWGQIREPATMKVHMQVEGDRVVGVQTPGGGSYARPVQRAVRKLKCSSGDSPSKAISFQLTFRPGAGE